MATRVSELVNPFDRNGLALLSDIQSAEWQFNFKYLEELQNEFRDKEKAFRSPEYIWPRDPLHCWSRVWEYPYVYSNIRKWIGNNPTKIADIGSGVTFFPFAVAKLGHEVVCCDIDPVCRRDIAKAVQELSENHVSFRLIADTKLPFENQELDSAYCVSVLEHVPNFSATILEISRILKPGGLLILTIDRAFAGQGGISGEDYKSLFKTLSEHFESPYELSLRTSFSGALLSDRGPFPMHFRSWEFYLRESIKRILGRATQTRQLLGVEGFVLRKK